jgi:hypothetical protein
VSTQTAALTAYRASGRAVVDTTDVLTDDEGMLPDVVVTTPALFVCPESLLGAPVEALDEDEASEVVEAFLDSVTR